MTSGAPFVMPFAIAAGGAVGALARHYVGHWLAGLWTSGPIPVGILSVNVLGSLAMGLLVEGLALKFELPAPLRAALIVGFLGAFTTFSTFSLETVLMLERHQYWQAGLYVSASVVLSVGALLVGMWLIRVLP